MNTYIILYNENGLDLYIDLDSLEEEFKKRLFDKMTGEVTKPNTAHTIFKAMMTKVVQNEVENFICGIYEDANGIGALRNKSGKQISEYINDKNFTIIFNNNIKEEDERENC